jgi:TolB protein
MLLAASVLVLVGGSCLGTEIAQGESRAEQGIVGAWHADSVVVASENGAKKTLASSDRQPLNVSVSDTTMIMRVGEQKLAEMPYALDSTQTPLAIDVQYQGEQMRGICELKGDRLKISLGSAKNERPQNFGAAANSMDLVLHRFEGQPLMVMNADGTELRLLLSMPEYTSCGAPKWSRDGAKIVFDARRSLFGDVGLLTHVFSVNADGTSPTDLGDGCLPSWSPDGKRIAFSRYSPVSGIWVMNADGTDKQLIDDNGWGADWSPKDDKLAYSQGANICIYDLKSKQRRYLLDKERSHIYWGLAWSPDGNWICYKGTLPDGGPEIALVHAEGQAKGFKTLVQGKAMPPIRDSHNMFSWSVDSKHVLAPLRLDGDAQLQLYLLDPDGEKPPQRLQGQDAKLRNVGSSWSPDGKKIVISFGIGRPAK